MSDPENIESPVARLLEHVEQGHYFHGSPNGSIEILEPRPAKDVDPERTFNNDEAVFATELPTSAIAFAVVDRSKLPEEIQEGTWYTFWNDDNTTHVKIPKRWKDHVELMRGIVYVLKPDSFTEKQRGQAKSKKPVEPIDKIEVGLQDFIDMGGNIEWI